MHLLVLQIQNRLQLGPVYADRLVAEIIGSTLMSRCSCLKAYVLTISEEPKFRRALPLGTDVQIEIGLDRARGTILNHLYTHQSGWVYQIEAEGMNHHRNTEGELWVNEKNLIEVL